MRKKKNRSPYKDVMAVATTARPQSVPVTLTAIGIARHRCAETPSQTIIALHPSTSGTKIRPGGGPFPTLGGSIRWRSAKAAMWATSPSLATNSVTVGSNSSKNGHLVAACYSASGTRVDATGIEVTAVMRWLPKRSLVAPVCGAPTLAAKAQGGSPNSIAISSQLSARHIISPLRQFPSLTSREELHECSTRDIFTAPSSGAGVLSAESRWILGGNLGTYRITIPSSSSGVIKTPSSHVEPSSVRVGWRAPQMMAVMQRRLTSGR